MLRGLAHHEVSHRLEGCNHGAELDLLVDPRGQSVPKEPQDKSSENISSQWWLGWLVSGPTYSTSASLMSRPIRIAGGKSTGGGGKT